MVFLNGSDPLVKLLKSADQNNRLFVQSQCAAFTINLSKWKKLERLVFITKLLVISQSISVPGICENTQMVSVGRTQTGHLKIGFGFHYLEQLLKRWAV